MDIYVAGAGMTRFGRHLERDYKDLTHETVEEATAVTNLFARQ